jgi:N-acyl-D-aspartate/D-glutamate deacylase
MDSGTSRSALGVKVTIRLAKSRLHIRDNPHQVGKVRAACQDAQCADVVGVDLQRALDLLIRDGNLIDGTSAPARRADVAVRGNRIVAIEPGCMGSARRIIEARGCAVAPGFIDVKTHSDFTLPLYPRAESRVHQGITTEIVGSCGFTVAPVPRGRLAAAAEYLAAMGPSLTFREPLSQGTWSRSAQRRST